MRIGIIREGKTPPDTRVPLTPKQCAFILQRYSTVNIIVEPSPNRCYTDEEYRKEGITVSEDLSNCEVLMGVKEVPIKNLVSDKAYFFFSHTIKKQVYNRPLLQAILAKNIHMLDYEVLTDKKGKRLIAFGRWAGIVGAHNGLWTYGNRTKAFSLQRMKDSHDFAEAKALYKDVVFPKMKVVVTGTGRVSTGAIEVLEAMGMKRVPPAEFLTETYDYPVFTQLACRDYAVHKETNTFVKKNFYANPQDYRATFLPYTRVSDLMINGIYWDNKAPQFFTTEDMKRDDFNIQVIADVTCDIAPVASIPATLFATTIADPVFGYNPQTEQKDTPYQAHTIDMMTIDNLPNELPRDASAAFGERFIQHIIEELLEGEASDVIQRATVAKNGALGQHFHYLKDYVEGETV